MWWCINTSTGCITKHHIFQEKTQETAINSSCSCSLTAGQSALQQCENLGEVVSPPLLVLMSACLHRAPWKRSVGSCWTAKGASSGEVRPRLFSCCCTGGGPWALTARRDKTASRHADKQAERSPLVCCQHVTAGNGPHFLAHLNANTLYTRAETALPISSVKRTVTQHLRLSSPATPNTVCEVVLEN